MKKTKMLVTFIVMLITISVIMTGCKLVVHKNKKNGGGSITIGSGDASCSDTSEAEEEGEDDDEDDDYDEDEDEDDDFNDEDDDDDEEDDDYDEDDDEYDVDDEDEDDTYEFYLTKDQLLKTIDQGYVFSMDKSFNDTAQPCHIGGGWDFYVHENNTLNLNLSYSNLFCDLDEKEKEELKKEEEEDDDDEDDFLESLVDDVTSNIRRQIVVKVISPEGKCVYKYSKKDDEISKDASIQKKIDLTPGKWTLITDYNYVSRGGDQPSNLKITAAYDKPSQKDIEWLKKERTNNDD